METERLPRGADPATHAKLGRGGLADVEWAVQLLQLRHAYAVPALRTTRTLEALTAAPRGRAGRQRRTRPRWRPAWTLAARVRNALMLVRGRPTDQLPRHGVELAGAVRLLGGGDPGEFLDDYLRTARRARAAMEHVLPRWGAQRAWLPGPFQVMSHMRTTREGGDVTASGRVSPRVDRLALEWGEGRRVDATVDDGVFGVQVDTGDVTADAELVAYDRTGAEIGRRSMDGPLYEFGPCYTDPAGRVIYDRIPPAPADTCLPAEPWGR